MLLLVIGLVAVIIAILVAVFLSMRRGQDDDERDGRPTVRDRVRGRGRGRDARWDSEPAEDRAPRHPAGRGSGLSRRLAAESRGYGSQDRGYEPADYNASRGHEPSPRGYDGQRGERAQPTRRGGRYDKVPEAVGHPAARAPRAATSASAARGGRGAGFDTGPGAALYDTGPSAAAADDLTAVHINADPDLADSDVFPRVRADIPRPDNKPPASKPRQRSQPKGRGRPSRGRHDDDDDDWPSTEWDKLSDEQYWAELSADKPLATTARSAQPNTTAKPAQAAAAPKGGRSTAPPATSRSATSRSAAPRTPSEPAEDRAADRRPDRGRPAVPRRPGTPQPGTPQPGTPQPGTPQPGTPQPGTPQPGTPQPGTPQRGTRRTDTRQPDITDRPDLSRQPDVTERLPVRDRPRPPAEAAAFGPAAPIARDTVARDTVGRGPVARDADEPTMAAPAIRPAAPAGRPRARGRADDDPLTSPSFSREKAPTQDSRSYHRSAGRSRQQNRPRDADEHQSGGYPAAGHGGYPSALDGYDTNPGSSANGRRGYPEAPGRHGYQAGTAERTDPNGLRPAATRQPAATPPDRPGYPAAAAGPRTGWDGDRRPGPAAPSPQAGAGNPYGSYVDSAPPPRPETGTSPYPESPAPAGGSYAGYGTGPSAAYTDPYGPAVAGYQPASGTPEQGSTWYSAPPPAVAPAAPESAAAYPYPATPSGGYPENPDYGTQASQAGHGDTHPDAGQNGTRYPGAYSADPYGPDEYGDYHSRQG